MTEQSASASTTPERQARQDHDHGRDGLRPHHARRATCGSTCSARPARTASCFMWDDLVRGAIGAVVLVDTQRLDRVLPRGRLLREPRHPVRRRGQLLRRRASSTSLDDVREALAVPGRRADRAVRRAHPSVGEARAARDDPARDHPGCGRSLARRSLSPQDLLECTAIRFAGRPVRRSTRSALRASPVSRAVAEPAQRLGLPSAGPVVDPRQCVIRSVSAPGDRGRRACGRRGSWSTTPSPT